MATLRNNKSSPSDTTNEIFDEDAIDCEGGGLKKSGFNAAGGDNEKAISPDYYAECISSLY